MRVGEIRRMLTDLPDDAPVVFRILSGPEGISITTWLNPRPDKLEVIFTVTVDEDDAEE